MSYLASRSHLLIFTLRGLAGCTVYVNRFHGEEDHGEADNFKVTLRETHWNMRKAVDRQPI